MFYAHSKKGESKEMWQPLQEHLLNTGSLAGDFASKFGAQPLGYIVGVMHDLGKYSLAFQRRLEGGKPTDHSTAGMQEVIEVYKSPLAKVMSYIIGGHHAGLPDAGSINDSGSLLARLENIPEDYLSYKEEIVPPDLTAYRLPLKPSSDSAFSLYFFTKMLFSCLVDADFLDTERYMDEDKALFRGDNASIQQLLATFNQHMEQILAKADTSKVNKDRTAILHNCLAKAQSEPGMFTLTVPTGGGKTLSSMAFALNHAVKNGMKRIVYVIPYTSIIEQNAGIFRNIFADTNVLEHHSNFQYKEDEDSQDSAKKVALAAENWDIPIVVTTNVQFFESIFANRGSRSRKLHNLAESVIILDEAQMLPVQYLKPCVLALSELVKNYHTSVILCTATQPNLNSLLPEEIKLEEIVEKPRQLYESFKRTHIINAGEMDDESLIEELREHPQFLCIVNTRKHARRLYEKLAATSGDGAKPDGIYHLSTQMYPKHRRKTLAEIRERLQATKDGEATLPCKVISTQLIEAGVDVDFPVVYRAMAGIDSIIQAAGRCNREGRLASANVYVFTSTEKHGQPPREMEINVSQAKSVFRNYPEPLSLEAIDKYFELLYDVKNVDQKNILADIKERAKHLEFPFAEVAQKFKLIEEVTIPVIVAADDTCRDLVKAIAAAPSYKPVRKLQPYIVSLYENEYKSLLEQGGIKLVGPEGMFSVLSDLETFYNEHTGIILRDDLVHASLVF